MPAIRFLHVLLLLSGVASAKIDERQFRADLAALTTPSNRIIGSDGYYVAERYLCDQIESLPNVELKRHEFPVTVPVTRSTAIKLPDGSIEPVYPFWPAMVRVNSTPQEGIAGRLVYCGTCTPEEIPPASLKGQIAVIESSAGERWTQASYFGARAILVLGTKDTTHVDLRSHDLLVPVNFPRFYIPPGALNDLLRAGQISGAATIRATVAWETRSAVNLYALVAPRVKLIEGWSAAQPPGALVISVPFDSSGLVPDLANGASQAVQPACGLALLRELSQNPLDRPVLVFFGGADSIQMLGTRNMLLALAEPPAQWDEELSDLTRELQLLRQQLARASQARPSPQSLSLKSDRAFLERVAQNIEIDTVLDQDQLFRLRMMSREQRKPQDEARIKQLEARQSLLNQLRYAFLNQPRRLGSSQFQEESVRYMQRTIDRLQALIVEHAARQDELRSRQELYRWLAERVGRNPDPARDATNERLIELLVALDLSDRGVRCGPMFFGQFHRMSQVADIQNHRDWFSRTARGFVEITDVIDFEPLNQTRAPQTFLAASMPVGSELPPLWGVPAFSIVTLDDLRLWRDTPNDTVENLDVDAVLPQLRAVSTLLRHAWNDPTFVGPIECKRNRNAVRGQVVAAAPGRPVPDLPREGFLATYFYTTTNTKKVPQIRAIPWTLGVRRNEVLACDTEGHWRIEGLPRVAPNPLTDLFVAIEVFRVDPLDGAIVAATDLGRQSTDSRPYADLRNELPPLRSLVFNCEEFSLTGLYDPRFLQPLGEMIPLDARRNAEPQRFNMILFNKLLAGFAEPGLPTQLVLRYGRVGNRLLLLNEDAPGFTPWQFNSLKPLALVTSRDFWALDESRLNQYRAAGVSSRLVDSLHDATASQLRKAQSSYVADRGADLVRHAAGAWSNEARVYAAAEDMARDVVRGAIFLLLLCIPFAFVMERLLIATPDIYRQIASSMAIFLLMAAVMWTFHPAFRISTSPLIILLAFAIMFMSAVVIAVVHGKFIRELAQMRSGRGGAPSATFARSGVITSAVLLGIANMRRRKFRTVLTSLTIVLITFAVLCFTSASQYLDTTSLSAGVATSHPGIMLRQRGFRPIPLELLDSLRPVVRSTLGRDPTIAQRWWNLLSTDPREMVDLVAPQSDGSAPRVIAVSALLGLSTGESNLSSLEDVIGPASFARLENGETNIIYLARGTADELRVHQGATVLIGGIPLEVAGIYDPDEFDQNVKMLSGESIAPLKYASGALDRAGRKLEDVSAESLELDGGSSLAELRGVYQPLSSSQFAIVPMQISRMMNNGTLRSIGIRVENQDEVKLLSDELARRYSLALFAGFDDGVRIVVAGNLVTVSGAGQVAIPLLIGGLIIFNTMMGSIAERRREIQIYTSLGLAPMHVGVLFVAEAMTYGLIGVVFGYIVGQGVGTALVKLGWLGGVTLNYSGTSAILTMGLILLIVLLSALVPARLAAKLAAPSIERSWKVPEPLGDEIQAELPFTINGAAADGVLAYLVEFFGSHHEGSIGKFSADRVQPLVRNGAHGLQTTIWLTPFDLGVRQRLELLIQPGQLEDIFEVRVILTRLSGDDRSWHRMNRPFLTELRQQFLQWRTLSPRRMLEYVDASRQMFELEKAPA